MGVMAAVGYMAAETRSETQGGEGVRPVGTWGGAKTEGRGHNLGWGQDGSWAGGGAWSQGRVVLRGSTKTTEKSRRERVGPWLRAEPRPDFRKEGAWSHGRDSLRAGPRP